MWSKRLLLLLWLTSCAGAETATKPDAPATAPVTETPAAEDDLEKAFAPEAARPSAPQPQRPPEAPRADPFARFKPALAEGQAALKSKQLDAARAAAATAVQEAASLDGDARFQAGQLSFRVELAAADAPAATQAARAWRLTCGPEKADACRAAAGAAQLAAAKLKGADKALLKRAKEVHDAEACAAKAERAAKPPPCEGATLATANREKDAFLSQRVALGRALREPAEARQVALLEKAEGACELPGCAGLRRKALGKLLAQARAKGDVDRQVALALREVAVLAALVPEDGRTWVRTRTLEDACPAFDAAHGAGSCRALEKKELGRWTFIDFSKEPAGEGLSAGLVRQVNEHFSPLIQQCLAEQAKRMTPPDAQRFELRWVVFNDGRVGEAHLRKDQDATPLAKCLRAQFSGWRYPRYEGEFQHVEQAFTVTAVERRAVR